ncbi:hypothetical protein NAT51_15400 [Flavobacterium amniphilum]|uniref:hypothetical protein n=1 Tax=Flavobacterium amniphilum TaxID=1834035 RepID=UPI00202A90C0|nr:hypothetical protein [Flavobacterium amniphilum]MCL9806921.1 hypothetical protein [Flavobacterium amniphilum]
MKNIKKIFLLLPLLFFVDCQPIFSDYDYNEKLTGKFYLSECDAYESKFIRIDLDDTNSLALVLDVVEVVGDEYRILVKTKDEKNKIEYRLINVYFDEYQEDVDHISQQEYLKKKKKMSPKYYYDAEEGFVAY